MDLSHDRKAYYVYLLIDPRNDEVFYVGKGTENRIFQHDSEVKRGYVTTKKQERIESIISSNHQLKKIIVGRFDTEEEAYAVESTLIHWVYGLENLTNDQSGHGVNFIRPKGNYTFLSGIDEPEKDYSEREREKRDRYGIKEYLLEIQNAIEESLNIKFDFIDESEDKHTYLHKQICGVNLSIATHHNPKKSAAVTIQCLEKKKLFKDRVKEICNHTQFEVKDHGRYARIPPAKMLYSTTEILNEFNKLYQELIEFEQKHNKHLHADRA